MTSWSNLLGAPTPTKLASWALFAAGVATALGSLFMAAGDFWLGIGLALIGLSMLVDALLPGGSDLDESQLALVRQIGVPQPRHAHKLVSVVIGTPLLVIGAYLAFG